MDCKSTIVLLYGPTASGKSKLATELSKILNGEIVNADSMQVYKELRILTSRPSPSDVKKVKHHLYGFISVKKNFSTGAWLNIATKKIKSILKKKKVPILVGGTGLYFKSLIDGLAKLPKISQKAREEIRSLQKKIGQKKFYQSLIKLDPLIKNQINSNDVQRSIRAFEIKKFTKISIIKWFQNTKILFDPNTFVKIYIDFPRTELLNRVRKRVDQMFKEGSVSEVKKFNRLRVKKENSAHKVIGILEIRKYLKGESNLSETKEIIYIKTRQYAKSQTTWARRQMTSWQKINPQDLSLVLKKFK